jgi:hypothetical protein
VERDLDRQPRAGRLGDRSVRRAPGSPPCPIADADAAGVEETFDAAKRARLGLAAKPTVRAGIAVWQVEIPDEPGALARITAVLGEGGVNIEDLQIVHSTEGGRGTVHVTVAAETAASAAGVLTGAGYDPTRLA